MKDDKNRECCPECGKLLHPNPAMNALDRRDNKTKICSDCGKKQGLG